MERFLGVPTLAHFLPLLALSLLGFLGLEKFWDLFAKSLQFILCIDLDLHLGLDFVILLYLVQNVTRTHFPVGRDHGQIFDLCPF